DDCADDLWRRRRHPTRAERESACVSDERCTARRAAEGDPRGECRSDVPAGGGSSVANDTAAATRLKRARGADAGTDRAWSGEQTDRILIEHRQAHDEESREEHPEQAESSESHASRDGSHPARHHPPVKTGVRRRVESHHCRLMYLALIVRHAYPRRVLLV